MSGAQGFLYPGAGKKGFSIAARPAIRERGATPAASPCMVMDFEPLKPTRPIGFAAAWAVIISLSCVLIGQGAAQFVGLDAPGGAAGVVAEDLGPAKVARPNFDALDFTPTGAVKDRTNVLNPCTGKQVAP